MERVIFETSDRVKIIGDWVCPNGASKAVLLLHMMPATRISWEPLIETFNAHGIASLAIDLRGHGESTAAAGSTLNYKNFTDTDHQASRLDVDAAVNFLKQKGFSENAITFAGASIGANLSLDALARYAETKSAVLLSPGLDYRGVKTEQPMRSLGAEQKVWLIAAEGDAYSAESVRTLHEVQKTQSILTIFKGAEHGTTLFTTQPNLCADIVRFFPACS